MRKTNKDYDMIIDIDFKLKRELDELKKRLMLLGREVAEVKKANSSDLLLEVENVKQNLQDLEESLSIAVANTDVIAQQITDISQQITDLAEQISELENTSSGGDISGLAAVATTGNYADLFARPDEYFELAHSFRANYHQVWAIDKNALRTKRAWFINSIDDVIEGKIKFGHQSSVRQTNVVEQLQLMFNEEVIDSIDVTVLLPSELHKEFTFKVKPKSRLNNFSINATKNDPSYSARHYISYFTIEITYGKNIFFLNRDFNYNAFVYQDNYYITKNRHPGTNYFTKNKDDFDFTTGIGTLDQSAGKDMIMFPYCWFPSNNDYGAEINKNLAWYMGLDSNGEYPKVIIKTAQNVRKVTTPEICHSYSISYFRENLNIQEGPSACFIFGEERRLVFWENTVTVYAGIKNFTLNGQPVETGVWFEVAAVNKQDMTGVNFRGFKGCVAMKFNGECIFFPHYDCDYTLNLGFGRKINVYYQDNENIHVYMGRMKHVVKKVLVKNLETGRYEVDKALEKRIDGYDEIVETLDDYYIGMVDNEIFLVPLNSV